MHHAAARCLRRGGHDRRRRTAGDDLDGVAAWSARSGRAPRCPPGPAAARRVRCAAPSASRRAPTGRARRRRSGRARTSVVRACASGATPTPHRQRRARTAIPPTTHRRSASSNGPASSAPAHTDPRQRGKRADTRAAAAADGGPRRHRRTPARRRARVARWRARNVAASALATNSDGDCEIGAGECRRQRHRHRQRDDDPCRRQAHDGRDRHRRHADHPERGADDAGDVVHGVGAVLERAVEGGHRQHDHREPCSAQQPRHGPLDAMRCRWGRHGGQFAAVWSRRAGVGDVTMIGWCNRTPQSRRVRLSGPPG